jgi:hypothetical protein
MREEKGKNRAKKVDFFSKLKKFKRVHHVQQIKNQLQ